MSWGQISVILAAQDYKWFSVELTSHSPPPTPLLPSPTPSAGESKVSGGEFKVSRRDGAASQFHAPLARSPKWPPSMVAFSRLLFGVHGGAPSFLLRLQSLPQSVRRSSYLGLPAALVWLVVSYLFDHPLHPTLLPPHHHHHDKTEDYDRRAERWRQSQGLSERCTPRQRQPSRP